MQPGRAQAAPAIVISRIMFERGHLDKPFLLYKRRLESSPLSFFSYTLLRPHGCLQVLPPSFSRDPSKHQEMTEEPGSPVYPCNPGSHFPSDFSHEVRKAFVIWIPFSGCWEGNISLSLLMFHLCEETLSQSCHTPLSPPGEGDYGNLRSGFRKIKQEIAALPLLLLADVTQWSCAGQWRTQVWPRQPLFLAVPVNGVMGIQYLGSVLKCSLASRYKKQFPLSNSSEIKVLFLSLFSPCLSFKLSCSECGQGKQMLPTALLKHQELGVSFLVAENISFCCLHRFSD